MVDNISLKIEYAALKYGSYIEAILEFLEENEVYDSFDMKDILHPTIIQKLEQEFIDKRFFQGNKKININDFIKG
jgi:hypothetical protein